MPINMSNVLGLSTINSFISAVISVMSTVISYIRLDGTLA